jgi:hypothetical protein
MAQHTTPTLLAALVVCGAGASLAHAAAPLAAAPGARVVTVSPPGTTASEPAIAVNPLEPHEVVAVGGRWAAYSIDAGATFTPVRLTSDDRPPLGDVSLAFDDRGRLFLSYLAIQKNGLPGYWGHGTGGNGIWVLRSPDGGKTWDPAPVGVKVWKGDEPDVKLEDMPRIWSDTGATSPHRGNLYMAWIEWQLEQSIILYTRSSDGGQTWATPMRISTRAGLPRDDNGAVVGPIGTVAPDGTIYVIWNEGFNITLAISKDGGRSFKPSRPIFDVAAPYFGGASGIPGVARCMGFPQVGIDPKLGRLYVTWSDFRNGDVDVFISRSDDHGKTWTAPMRVNNDPVHDGADQFLQWMAVDTTDGSVNVQFYDRRDDPANRLTRVTLARSTDGGQSFTNYAWTAEPFATDRAFLGDYEWLVALGGRVFGTWAEPAPAGYVVVVPRAPSTVASTTPTIIRVGSADFRTAH